MIDDGLRAERSDRGADAVGHDHEESLRRGADRRIGLLIDEERPRDVEEVEGHTIDDHRKDEHPHAVSGVAQAEESKTEHPGEHGHEHDVLDAEAFQAEGNEQDAERFGDLRQRDQRIGVVGAERGGIFGDVAETGDEGIRKAVGNLQRNTQQHREDEEQGHLLLLEEREGAQPEGLDQALALGRAADRTRRKGHGIEPESETQHGALDELHAGSLETGRIADEHRAR